MWYVRMSVTSMGSEVIVESDSPMAEIVDWIPVSVGARRVARTSGLSKISAMSKALLHFHKQHTTVAPQSNAAGFGASPLVPLSQQ